jgi:FAD/FMN-containing dehydrogenase
VYSYRESVHWSHGRFAGWYVFAEPKDMKEIEKFAVNEFAKFGKEINPVNYYSHPFDYGRSFLLRIAGFTDPKDIELRKKISKKFEEMYDVALKRYRAVPIRPIGSERAGTYMHVLASIKKALDPNNILNRDSGLFEEGEL